MGAAVNSDCFVVTGYNNTRIYDIAKLREICRQEYGAKVVLITEQAKPQDHAAADVVLVAPLGEVDTAAAAPIAARLGELGLRPVGILPFSDRGVPRAPAWPGTSPCRASIRHAPRSASTSGASATWRPRRRHTPRGTSPC